MGKHFCASCRYHWSGVVRRHNCGTAQDCRVSAMRRWCPAKAAIVLQVKLAEQEAS